MTMSEQLFQQLKTQSLSDTANYLEQLGDYPEQPDPRYPLFPAALREVERVDPPEKCLNCHKPGYYYPADRAYAPGHCYSDAGVREFRVMSSICEFCFDHMFRDPDEDVADNTADTEEEHAMRQHQQSLDNLKDF
ncbi:hypothetical protein SEA_STORMBREAKER_28 [Microbacterium phage Stormbreaker]|uniref:Uncharacterized protein n=1 Tax=Microbacterium phage Stormbreaker TaxID=2759462 RepID=A0A7G9A0G2_9CAUD|nr:hypothetical protein SEA_STORMBREAKER_28 [Microbacterium phage Stormbreaker]